MTAPAFSSGAVEQVRRRRQVVHCPVDQGIGHPVDPVRLALIRRCVPLQLYLEPTQHPCKQEKTLTPVVVT